MTARISFCDLANYPCPEPELRRWSGQDLIRYANSFEDSARKSRRVSDWASHDRCIIRIGQLDGELKRRGLSHRHDYANLSIGPEAAPTPSLLSLIRSLHTING